jgi:hypothetical protein
MYHSLQNKKKEFEEMKGVLGKYRVKDEGVALSTSKIS